MYRPPIFQEDRPSVLHAAIRAHPLATLVTAGSSGLIANLSPFILVEAEAGGSTRLQTHLAVGNGQLADLADGAETLVIFHGPQAYISPSWYPTKREHGRVVPTWNYITVQARGRVQIIDEPSWVMQQLHAITDQMEAEKPQPWAVTDAPPNYVASQLSGIRGVEMTVDRLEGKWKASQNQPASNQAGVARGLRDSGHAAFATQMPGPSKIAESPRIRLAGGLKLPKR